MGAHLMEKTHLPQDIDSERNDRLRRKAGLARLETTIHDLTFENANLHRENERLRALLRQLQSEPSSLDTTPEICVGSSRPHKKARTLKNENENGVTDSFDSSESAEEFPSGYGPHRSILAQCSADECDGSSSGTGGSTSPDSSNHESDSDYSSNTISECGDARKFESSELPSLFGEAKYGGFDDIMQLDNAIATERDKAHPEALIDVDFDDEMLSQLIAM